MCFLLSLRLCPLNYFITLSKEVICLGYLKITFWVGVYFSSNKKSLFQKKAHKNSWKYEKDLIILNFQFENNTIGLLAIIEIKK